MMAKIDYRCCDVCDSKVFYDANLNYCHGPQLHLTTGAYRQNGEAQFADPKILEEHGLRLDYLGDWAVICDNCAKTHKTIVVPIESTSC
jgi:hypothetical protein